MVEALHQGKGVKSHYRGLELLLFKQELMNCVAFSIFNFLSVTFKPIKSSFYICKEVRALGYRKVSFQNHILCLDIMNIICKL